MANVLNPTLLKMPSVLDNKASDFGQFSRRKAATPRKCDRRSQNFASAQSRWT
jgi:hypothetical protein